MMSENETKYAELRTAHVKDSAMYLRYTVFP